VKDVIKAIGNNEERKRNYSTETQDFNVKNPLQQREVKTTGASQQNFTISRVFTKRRGVTLMMRFTLAGGLQGVYIGGSNDPYHSAQASGDGPRFARRKLAFTL
jgi:hypothetical protein